MALPPERSVFKVPRTTMLLCLFSGLATLSAAATDPVVRDMITTFQRETVFWQQAEIGDRLVSRAKLADLAPLEPWLTHDDRHTRGNVAWVFAKLGDRRGFDTLVAILGDRSVQRVVHEPVLATNVPLDEWRKSPEAMTYQIRTDRYYAVHLLGTLRDPRAVPVLIPLLDEDEQGYNAAWALGEIGDARAIPPLIRALSNKDAVVRVAAIGALQKLNAREALPQITALFDDHAIPQAGEQVPVGQTARKAAHSLQADGIPGVRPGETLLEQSRRMRDHWRSSGVVAYRMWPYGEYNQFGKTPPVEVTVRDGKVTDIVLTQDYQGHREGEHFTKQDLTQFTAPPIVTVENFFTLIQKMADPRMPTGTIDYNLELGYPTRAYFDDKAMADDEVLVVIRKLEVLERKP